MRNIVKDFVRQLRRLPDEDQTRHLEELLSARIDAIEKGPSRAGIVEERRELAAKRTALLESRTGPDVAVLRTAADRAAEELAAARLALRAASDRSAAAEMELYTFHADLDRQASHAEGRLRESAHPVIARVLRDLLRASFNAPLSAREEEFRLPGMGMHQPPIRRSNLKNIVATQDAIARLRERAETLRLEPLDDDDVVAAVTEIREQLLALPYIGQIRTAS